MVVEDDRSFSFFLKTLLTDSGFDVVVYNDPELALKNLLVEQPDLVLVDLKMPKMSGLTFIERGKRILPFAQFIVITAFGTIPSAVEAIKKGAVDYVTKPIPDTRSFVNKVKEIVERVRKIDSVGEGIPPLDIVFAGMEEVYEKILNVAPTDTTVTLYGETGTGKSLIAKIIHNLSGRKGNFVDVNCASIPETLMESELFGFNKGAFTGALRDKPGKFELADGGTIFLDEIGEMSPALQAKLLKVIQEKKFERIGGLKPINIDVRFIFATNKNLEEMVKEGKFREDLYYRINVFPIYIPPLRARKNHILKITEYIVENVSLRLKKNVRPLSERSINLLLEYDWPGNIRELENVIERSVIISKGDYIELDIGFSGDFSILTSETKEDLKELEKLAIIRALEKSGGNKKKASETLGISLRTLYNKLKKYNLEY
jgi:DNA-binding NtrC family response regulator